MYPIKGVAAGCSVAAVTFIGAFFPAAAVDMPASTADRVAPWTAPVSGPAAPDESAAEPKPAPAPAAKTRAAKSPPQPAPDGAEKSSAQQPAAEAEVSAAGLSADIAQRASKDEEARRLDAPMPQGPLTLNDAVLLAVTRHPTITSQIATVAQARGGIEVAKAGYYPQITMGTGSGSSTKVRAADGSVVSGGSANTVSMQISQMLWDFGKVSSSVDQAESTVRREQANLLLQLSGVEQKTAETFINAHRYQEQVEIARQEVDATQQIYEMARLRAQSGVSSRSDPIQAQTRVQSAQATLIAVKTLNDEMAQHLRTLVGGEVKDGVAQPLSDERLTAIQLDKKTLSTSLMPGVLVAQTQELIARGQLDNAKAQMWPTFALNYANTKNVTGTNASTNTEKGSNHSLTVGIQWTAYQGGALAGQIKSAQFALEAARLNVASARLAGSDAARGYREQALGARTRLSKLGERKASIAATRDLYREQYKLGTRSILDVLNAEQEYYQAALDEETAKHDYWIALVDYIGALGTGNTFYGIASRSIQGVKVQ
jgi:adhesin transport system outer membrane protein